MKNLYYKLKSNFLLLKNHNDFGEIIFWRSLGLFSIVFGILWNFSNLAIAFAANGFLNGVSVGDFSAVFAYIKECEIYYSFDPKYPDMIRLQTLSGADFYNYIIGGENFFKGDLTMKPIADHDFFKPAYVLWPWIKPPFICENSPLCPLHFFFSHMRNPARYFSLGYHFFHIIPLNFFDLFQGENLQNFVVWLNKINTFFLNAPTKGNWVFLYPPYISHPTFIHYFRPLGPLYIAHCYTITWIPYQLQHQITAFPPYGY